MVREVLCQFQNVRISREKITRRLFFCAGKRQIGGAVHPKHKKTLSRVPPLAAESAAPTASANDD